MSDRQDEGVEPLLEAAVRRALGASARSLPPSTPRLAAVLRAGRRRRRARRTAAAAAVVSSVAALCVTVPLLGAGTSSRNQAASAASVRPAPGPTVSPSSSPTAPATDPAVLTLGSGRLDGIDWDAQVSFDGRNICQHLVIGGAQVDAPAGHWTDCVPAEETQADGDVGVHVAGASGLRLLTAFGVDTVTSVVVTFTDGTTRQGTAVRLRGSGAEGAVVPIAPGQRIAVIAFYDARGTRVGQDSGYA